MISWDKKLAQLIADPVSSLIKTRWLVNGWFRIKEFVIEKSTFLNTSGKKRKN